MSFLTASPNWYCCKVSDCNEQGVYIFGAQNKVYIFSVADFLPKFTRCIDAHSERITSLSFSAKENWIFCSGSEDGFLKVWNIHEKILIKQHAAHQPGKISAVSWSCVNDTLIVSGDDKGDICIWRLDVDPVIYNPERGNVSDLKTSLHDEDIVAVGYKSGLILLINIGNKRSIIHKLKGHDEEIQSIVWYPFKHHKMDEESWRDVTGDSIVEPSQVMEELGSGCLIASGSKDKSIRVWSSNNGKCLQILKLPNNIGYRRHEEPGLRGRLWLTLTWLKNKPRHLVSSSFGGELLLWDLNKQGKQKWQVFGVGKEGQNRTIFNICPVPPDDDTLITISMGRQIVFWDVPSMKSKIILPTLGGFLYSICYSNLNPGFLALGVGDNMIRVWNTGNPNDSYDITVLWQGIRSNVTTVSWHPEKEGILAYGTKDGRVGIYNTFSNKAPEVSNTYHRDTVYVVTWGPACYGEMDEISSEINLYSVGDGFILQHQRNQFQKDAVNVNDLIKQTNKMSHCSQKSEMRWKSDLSIVAIGNEDGSVDLCKPPHLKILCTVCVQRKLVNCLRWHPTFTMSSPSGSALHSWLAIGSNENIVKVIDTISVLVQESTESTQTLTTCIRELEGHTARVTSLSWSTHVDGLLVSASYDGTAQVWNVITGEPLGNYRGHSERLLSVQWSPLFVDEIYSGGCDLSLHKWDVKTLTEKLPPKEGNTSFKGKENDKKRSNKSKKKKKEPMKTNETKNADLESLISVDNLNNEEITELEQLLEQKRREILDAAKTKTIISSSVDGVIDVSKRSESVKDIENSDHFDKDISVTKQPAYIPDNCKDIIKKSETIKSINFPRKELKDRKKRKTKSFFPVSSTLDNRGKIQQLNDCIDLANMLYSRKDCSENRGGIGEFAHLGVFLDRRAAFQVLHTEALYHLEYGQLEYVMLMDVWKGDISELLQKAESSQQINDWLIALASFSTHPSYVSICKKYAQQLEYDGQLHKGVSFLLACHNITEAIRLLQKNFMFRDALLLAKLRLNVDDPLIETTCCAWIDHLIKESHIELAAKCYISLKKPEEAINLLLKRNDCHALKVAIQLAMMTSCTHLVNDMVDNLVHRCLLSFDWQWGFDVLMSNNEIEMQEMKLILTVHELISTELKRSGYLPETIIQSKKIDNIENPKYPRFLVYLEEVDELSPWQPYAVDGISFMHLLLESLYEKCDASMLDQSQLETTYSRLQKFNIVKSASVLLPWRQCLVHTAYHITMSLVYLLNGQCFMAGEHLLKSLNILYTEKQYQLLQGLCRILFPSGIGYWKRFQKEVLASIVSMDPSKHTIKDLMDQTPIYHNLGGIYYFAVLQNLLDNLNNTGSGKTLQYNADKNISPNMQDEVLDETSVSASAGSHRHAVKVQPANRLDNCIPSVDNSKISSTGLGSAENTSLSDTTFCDNFKISYMAEYLLCDFYAAVETLKNGLLCIDKSLKIGHSDIGNSSNGVKEDLSVSSANIIEDNKFENANENKRTIDTSDSKYFNTEIQNKLPASSDTEHSAFEDSEYVTMNKLEKSIVFPCVGCDECEPASKFNGGRLHELYGLDTDSKKLYSHGDICPFKDAFSLILSQNLIEIKDYPDLPKTWFSLPLPDRYRCDYLSKDVLQSEKARIYSILDKASAASDILFPLVSSSLELLIQIRDNLSKNGVDTNILNNKLQAFTRTSLLHPQI